MKRNHENPPELIAIPDILPGDYSGIADVNDFTNAAISIQSDLHYQVFCDNFKFPSSTERIEPLYIKKPNIT